ncbi:MAG: hypothetical protein A4E56_03456 [Pelotomaculum sp. PtaU1.Bin065]|nr:MAG: hypothetical protein A4E56_03456 [Pelotomaculum sp. PtaU1.Bin065]
MRNRIIVLTILLCVFTQTPLFAEDQFVGKDIAVRIGYVAGTSNFSFDNSGESFYVRDGMMVEIIKENRISPYLNVGLASAYLKIQNEINHREFLVTNYTPSYLRGVYHSWHIASKQDAFLLLIRPNINVDIAQLINVGIETGFGVGYFMKNEKWQWTSSYLPGTNSAAGNLNGYSFDPYIDLGMNVSWLIDDKSSVGINFSYSLINSEFGHYNGGSYYRGGMFYKVNY